MTPEEYLQQDATALAALVRSSDVTPRELLDLAILRLEAVNPSLNAVVQKLYDFARKEIEAGLPEGPFRGVPFLLKDQTDLAGVATRRGSTILGEFISEKDSQLVARLRAAGVVIFGKTNMPELGLNVSTEPRETGPTPNPWNPAFSCGGSSGGSAAAITAGVCPAASAADGGGSIRIPASCCGLFGMKPSRGRVGKGWGGLTAHGVLSRSVRDSASLLDAISNSESARSKAHPSPAIPFAEATRLRPAKLRVALVLEPHGGGAVHTDCLAAVRQAATLCGNLGHEIIETKLPEELAGYREAASMMIRVNVFEQLEGIAAARGAKLRPDDVERATWTIYEAGKRASEDEYRRAVEEVRRAEHVMVQFGERFDLTLSPVLAEPPVALGVLDTMAEDVMAMFGRLREYSPFCNLFNATGQPAMSIPMIWNNASLPIGAQFAGHFGDEATLFQLAAQIEEAAPWDHKHRDLWKTL